MEILFSKADHPLKDSIQSNLVDSLKNDLSLFQIHHLTGQIQTLVILLFQILQVSTT